METFVGCVYADQPNDPVYRLSEEDLQKMTPELVGLPLRVEHGTRNAGRVVEAWRDGGRVLVRAQLNDDASGWGLNKLIRTGDVAELSLKHLEYPQKGAPPKKVPIEVSVVEAGARPNTRIEAPAAAHYITASAASRAAVMADAQASVPVPAAAAPSPVPAAPVVEISLPVDAAAAAPQPTVAAAAAAVAGEKRARDEQGRFLPDEERRQKLRSDAEKMMAVAEAVLPHVRDPMLSQQFVASITDMLQNSVASESVLAKKQSEMADLIAAAGSTKSTQKQMAKEIVEGIVTLWRELTPGKKIEESDMQHMMEVYESNPRFAYLSQPMVVAASAVATMNARKDQERLAAQLEAAKAAMAQMTSQLGAYGGVSEAPPVPQWSAPAPPQPPIAAAQVVAVAASAREEAVPQQQQSAHFALPPFLASLKPYDGMPGRVFASDIHAPKI